MKQDFAGEKLTVPITFYLDSSHPQRNSYIFIPEFCAMKPVAIPGILLIVMAAYLIIPAIPVIDYMVNKDYIAKNLCINKDKPKSCCKGKCHMIKQLQKADKNQDKDCKDTNKKVQVKEPDEFILNRLSYFYSEIVIAQYQNYNALSYNELAGSAIFVPPEHVS